jgi:putative DNA primase/helicase
MNYQQHMQASGIESPPNVVFDGRIHRFKTKRNKKNGWYIAYDNPQTVVYGDWTEPDIRNIWKADGGTQLSPAERKQIEERREYAKQRELQRKQRSGQRIARFYAKANHCTIHPYLNKKQIANTGLKEFRSHKRHLILIPMYSRERKVVGMQIIYANNFKRYVKGSTTKQVYCSIGTPDDVIYIAEGYATGATIHAVTGKAVAVAFSTGNLLEVASHLKKSYPDKRIIIAADNDRWSSVNTVKGKVENPGLYYASRAAELTGCEYRLPQFTNLETKPTDFNDLYALEGEEAVNLYLAKLTHNKTEEPTETHEYDTFEINEPIQVKQEKETTAQSNLHDPQFRCLGFSGDEFYFLPTKTNKIISISRGSMGSKTHLLSIASLDWWKSVFFQGEKEDWTFATDYLFRHQERVGLFDPARIRGRGAWFDLNRSVLHIGSNLIVDGEITKIHDFNTRFIYELAPAIESNIDTVPATVEQAGQVFDVFRELNFDKSISGHLLAGWCFLAPICSALDWRPHIWLTGSRGTGKSWIQEFIVDRIVGEGAFRTQGSTTEAGIRQTLKQDGRAVIFDESESEDQQGRRRMQSVIELARQASSNSSSGITKGTAGGDAMVFFIRSMFMFGSINVAINQASDESRISVLSLKKHDKSKSEVDKFHKFEKHVNNLLTDKLTASLRARAYKMIPVIRHNAKVIGRAIAEYLGSQRMGDQYGALLSGALAYVSDEEISLENAREYVKKIDFTEAQESEDVRDEERLIHTIMQHQIRAEVDGFNYNRSISEFVQIAAGSSGDNKLHNMDAGQILRRYGIIIEDGYIYVANNHSELKRILNDTAWGSGWARVLIRLDGALKAGLVSFNGTKSRCIKIPIDSVIG